jgi:phosphohistidine swiveling domain-containing protein/uncharacterized protein (DUF2164 family)
LFLEKRGEELCALRLMPKKDGLPKLRMRGKSIVGAYEWFKEQDINPDEYRGDFVPHAPDSSWATIFIVNKNGIQGEIIFGGHHQLTQGFHDGAAPIVFRFDFKDWTLTPKNDDALVYLKKLVEYLRVNGRAEQELLIEKLGATFTHDYIEGYFETTDSSMGTWFIDYNQSLGAMYADAVIQAVNKKNDAQINGQTASPGVAAGIVYIVTPENLDADFPNGGILVCEVTTPDYVPLMQKASAIVTNQGGILSHAAIIARELKKPAIVGTGNATTILTTGQKVAVDADKGTVSY